jgi:hypothetical protein
MKSFIFWVVRQREVGIDTLGHPIGFLEDGTDKLSQNIGI